MSRTYFGDACARISERVVLIVGGALFAGLCLAAAHACSDAGCDNQCDTNTGFCQSNTSGFYYSVATANQVCHPTGGPGGVPATNVNVSKTTISGGACAPDCTGELPGLTSGNPTGGRSTVSTTSVPTVCKPS